MTPAPARTHTRAGADVLDGPSAQAQELALAWRVAEAHTVELRYEIARMVIGVRPGSNQWTNVHSTVYQDALNLAGYRNGQNGPPS